MLAARADVREELDRLTAHVAAAPPISTAKGGAVGRKLDFLLPGVQPRGQHPLLQERRYRPRPISASSSRPAIEQLREQIQNIE